MKNNEEWGWAWYIALTYIVSGGGWVLGYVIYFPLTLIWQFNELVETIYATNIMLFEEPNRLTFEDWLAYPFRRYWMQKLIIFLGYQLLFFPGVSAIGLPLLGAWAINDWLDYEGWDSMWYTLSIPFED